MNKAKKHRASGIFLIVIAALLIELLSLVQYRYLRKQTLADLMLETDTELRIKTNIIRNTLKSAEATMRENMWDMMRCAEHPDSMFAATERLISVNPDIVGGCIAFVPYHYPEKGRLFEPYAYKDNGKIVCEQIGNEKHDYTQNPVYQKAMKERKPIWSDPYQYGKDIVLDLTTFSYPFLGKTGEPVAVCGIDIDLTWLSDSLNARHHYPSSFSMLLTREAKMTSPHPGRQELAEQVAGLIAEHLAQDSTFRPGHAEVIHFKDQKRNRKAMMSYTMMEDEPHWLVAMINYHDEIYAPVRKSWLQQMAILLTGLLILLFMIRRFVGKERELQRATLEHARLGGELDAARSIQMQMLPKDFPENIAGSLEPAWEVGGDLFDFFSRDDKLFFCIGDVSGKGVSAAMVMAEIYSLFRCVAEREDNPRDIVRSVNRKLCKDNRSFMFTTFFLGILDLPTGELRYCNAGHDHPFIVTKTAEMIPAEANMPLGVFPELDFVEQSLTLQKGCTLFLYTDGLTEAKNASLQMFTAERVKETLEHGPADPAPMLAAMNDAVKGFVNGADQSDDLTMLAIRY